METTYLFHDCGATPAQLESLQEVLKKSRPGNYVAPYLPHTNPQVAPLDSYKLIMSRVHIEQGSLILGVGLGGLIAAKLQEDSRQDLRVAALAAPTHVEGIALEKALPARLALYSSHDEKIKDAVNWQDFAPEAHEYTPLMFHDVDSNRFMIAFLVMAWLKGKDVKTELMATLP